MSEDDKVVSVWVKFTTTDPDYVHVVLHTGTANEVLAYLSGLLVDVTVLSLTYSGLDRPQPVKEA
jgi:hypothetical protein